MGGIEIKGPKIVFDFEIFGQQIIISETIVIGWIIIGIITLLVLFLTSNMKKIPSKKQVIAEWLVTTMNKMVSDSMGSHNVGYAPYMATIFAFSLFGSLISLFGLRPMTGDLNTTLGWALMTFFMIQACKFKANGFLGYFKTFTQPVPLMTPMNIISELATPVSMSFRHFGNIAGGLVITSLLYFALGQASEAIGVSIPILKVGIPAVLSVYFDLFTGVMQAYIFIMLSMAFIGSATEKE